MFHIYLSGKQCGTTARMTRLVNWSGLSGSEMLNQLVFYFFYLIVSKQLLVGNHLHLIVHMEYRGVAILTNDQQNITFVN